MFHHCGYICLVIQILFVGRVAWWLIKPRIPGAKPRLPKREVPNG
jgi:hypothetical protein